MKVKFTAKSSIIRHLINTLELDKESQVDLTLDLVENPRNKSIMEKYKNCMTRLDGGYGGGGISPMNIGPNWNGNYNPFGNIAGGNTVSNQVQRSLDKNFPTTVDELNELVRKIVYDILDEEYGDSDKPDYSTGSNNNNLFSGNFNPINQAIPSQVNLNQEEDLINSLLKPTVCGVDLNTVQGIAVMTIAVLRSIDPFSYSLSSGVIKNSIEWIRNGNGNNENLSFGYNIVDKINKHLGVQEWKQRINRFLRYGTNIKTCSLASALDYMYT